ncbi:MAG: hypothetical protein PHS37_03115 [Candidatus Omnitrophica bacterium]|nr:hypothetical protein [Candidatus Omnitrophota bacterium]
MSRGIRIFLSIVIVAVLIAAFNLPCATRQGINGVVRETKIPLYAKVAAFVARDHEYKQLTAEIIRGKDPGEDAVNAVFDWTVEHIKRPPAGFDIYDDHVWNIIIRQYGQADQMADVFTTLSSYAGYPAFFALSDGFRPAGRRYVLSFVHYGGKWHAYDLYARKKCVEDTPLDRAPSGYPYGEYINAVDKRLFDESVKRPDKQKIFPRILYEIKKRLSPTCG